MIKLVIAGLDPAIHHFSQEHLRRRWTRGSSPRVTHVVRSTPHFGGCAETSIAL
jgi:hypothetical protein